MTADPRGPWFKSRCPLKVSHQMALSGWLFSLLRLRGQPVAGGGEGREETGPPHLRGWGNGKSQNQKCGSSQDHAKALRHSSAGHCSYLRLLRDFPRPLPRDSEFVKPGKFYFSTALFLFFFPSTHITETGDDFPGCPVWPKFWIILKALLGEHWWL